MKKLILSGIVALFAVISMSSPANAKSFLKPLPPTNALAAWSEGYQYAMSHGWGQEDSLYWAHVQMQIWINHHS